MNTHFHFYHSSNKGIGRSKLVWLVRLGILIILLAVVLIFWYSLAPKSLARFLGRFSSEPLVVSQLEIELDRRALTLSPDQTLEINPADRIRYEGFSSNRWQNYDLEPYSPDFDISLIMTEARSLLSLLGEDAFVEPKIITILIREKGEQRAAFYFRAYFTAEDWALRGDSALEAETKIGYYRKALALKEGDPVFTEKLLAAMAAGQGYLQEQIEILEGLYAEAADDLRAQELLVRLLTLYREGQDKEGEIATITRLLALAEKNGQDREPYIAALAVLYRESDPQKSAEFYEELLLSSTGDETLAILTVLLNIYRELSLEDKEIETYERLLALVPDDQKSRIYSELARLRAATNDQDGVISAWEGLAQSLPSGQVKEDAYRYLGSLYIGRGEMDKAALAFEEASKLNPENPANFMNLSALAEQRGDTAAYLVNLERALALGDDIELRRELALGYLEAGQKDRAIEEFSRLCEITPNSPAQEAIREEARLTVLELLRPPADELSDEFEDILYKYSTNSVEFYNLGVAHFQRQNWDRAEKAFLQALDLGKGEGAEDIRAYLMALYKSKGAKEAMLAQASLLYKENPDNKEYRDLMAAEFDVSRDWQGLERAASDWVVWQPKDPDNWRFLALAQMNLNKPQEMAESLLGAAKAEPTVVDSWLAAAEALEKAGDIPAAKAAYQKVLELDEANDKAGQALLRMTLSDLDRARRER